MEIMKYKRLKWPNLAWISVSTLNMDLTSVLSLISSKKTKKNVKKKRSSLTKIEKEGKSCKEWDLRLMDMMMV